MIKSPLAIEFITYDGQPGSRPPFSDPAGDMEKIKAIKEAPLPHRLDGDLSTFMVTPADSTSPVDVALLCFYDPDLPESFEWYSSYPVFADGDYTKDSLRHFSEDAGVDQDGYLRFPLRKGDRWAFWPKSLDTRNENHLFRVIQVCEGSSRGIFKRIDENRELLEFLHKEAPDLMGRCPWLESWISANDHFYNDLVHALGSENIFADNKRMYPRPWSGTIQ